jgi:hypothetical protein
MLRNGVLLQFRIPWAVVRWEPEGSYQEAG